MKEHAVISSVISVVWCKVGSSSFFYINLMVCNVFFKAPFWMCRKERGGDRKMYQSYLAITAAELAFVVKDFRARGNNNCLDGCTCFCPSIYLLVSLIPFFLQ